MINYENKAHYKNLNNFQTGDVFFVKGKSNSFIDIMIRFITGSWIIHAAILVEIKGLWFVIEAQNNSRNSYQMVPLEWWFTRNRKNELYFGKMPMRESVNISTLRDILMDSTQAIRPYRISWCLLTGFLQSYLKVFRPNLEKLYNNSRPIICSTVIQEAWERVGAIEPANRMTPTDIVNYLGGENNLLSLQVQGNDIDSNREQLCAGPAFV